MTTRQARPRHPFTVHIQTETSRSRSPLDAGPLCGQPRRAVVAAEHPGRAALICPACATRWRELMETAETN
jgi:hypothetical protein